MKAMRTHLQWTSRREPCLQNQAVRFNHVGVQNGTVPATPEDVSSPFKLDERDADEEKPLLAVPDKLSIKRSASIKSQSSKHAHVPTGSSDRPSLLHSVSGHSDLDNSMLRTTASSPSTPPSLVTGRPQGMTDIASLSLSPERKWIE